MREVFEMWKGRVEEGDLGSNLKGELFHSTKLKEERK